MTNRMVWYIRISDDDGNTGIGEVAPIERLSPDNIEEIPDELEKIKIKVLEAGPPNNEKGAWQLINELAPNGFPSIRFGLEVAFFDLLNGGVKRIFSRDFSKINIPINGLIWMGSVEFMQEQIRQKLDEGFQCIKLKVGSNDFDAELEVIKSLRRVSEELVIRLDANGAFATNEVLMKLKALSVYDIHSIEQPILPMQPEAMEIICSKSTIPIALDEELIWIQDEKKRINLLQELKPHYLVLKPTLHGGFSTVTNWIEIADMLGINWWITSYLESNIGLNAIAQFTSNFENNEFHGLGTGELYHNNIISPIQTVGGSFRYAKSATWGDISF